jgi:hypothetical protein
MPTLGELQRENSRLRAQIKAKQELKEIGEERNRLLRENKSLLRQKKFSDEIEIAKRIGRKTAKVGKKIGNKLLVIARNIAEAEKREQRLRRKVSRPKKRKVKKKTRKTSKRR